MASEERKEAFLRAWFDAPEGSHWAHGMSNEVEQGVSDCFDKAIAAWNADAPISPDATGKCGELVTVETQFRMTDRTDRPWGNGPIPEYLNGYAVSRELVTRSQAEELLAAERAENTRLQSENDAQADQISELQMTPWPEWATKVLAVIRKRSGYDGYGDAIEGVDLPAELDECIAAIEADNAALTARVKELEQHCELLCDPTIIRLEKENSDLEAKLAAAEKGAFEHGYVLACCNIVNLHDEPTIAHDTLSELGVTRSDIKAMNLSEFDLKALRKIEGGCSGSPYAKKKRKARAALGGKP